jgi:putative tricarboxylic transport membrane protein
MTIANGDWTVFYTRPLSLTLLTLAAIGLIGPHVWGYIERRRLKGQEAVPGDA